MEPYARHLPYPLAELFSFSSEYSFIGVIFLTCVIIRIALSWKKMYSDVCSFTILVFIGILILLIYSPIIRVYFTNLFIILFIIASPVYVLITIANSIDNIRDIGINRYNELWFHAYSVKRSKFVAKWFATKYKVKRDRRFYCDMAYMSFKNIFTLYLAIFILSMLGVKFKEKEVR